MNTKSKKRMYIFGGTLLVLVGVLNFFIFETTYDKIDTVGFVIAGIVVIYLSKYQNGKG